MPSSNRESWAPSGARVFLLLQLLGLVLLAVSTNVATPLALSVTIVSGFVFVLAAIVLAIISAWRAGAERA